MPELETIYNPKGLDVEAVFNHRKKTGSILNYKGATKEFKNSSVGLEQECDILIPAALENQITSANISKIKAKIIISMLEKEEESATPL